MAAGRPYMGEDELFHYSDKIWFDLAKDDWLEAFSHHPKIGDIESLSKKFADTKQWAEGEQSGVNTASQEILQALAHGNLAYEDKFGYIFIVCATGKSAGEMLEILQERLKNDTEAEINFTVATDAAQLTAGITIVPTSGGANPAPNNTTYDRVGIWFGRDCTTDGAGPNTTTPSSSKAFVVLWTNEKTTTRCFAS